MAEVTFINDGAEEWHYGEDSQLPPMLPTSHYKIPLKLLQGEGLGDEELAEEELDSSEEGLDQIYGSLDSVEQRLAKNIARNTEMIGCAEAYLGLPIMQGDLVRANIKKYGYEEVSEELRAKYEEELGFKIDLRIFIAAWSICLSETEMTHASSADNVE